MASCENKYITLLDLSRQAKVITGETACFDGKIQVGIAFSGYPTGVDTGTTVSLGFVSGETAVFSGNTGTTVFDVSNSGSTNYNSLFSGYSGTVWSNALYSGNTSGLTLPITPLSADSQVIGPIWTLTQTATTSNGEHIIDIQYTGYSITYSFNQLDQLPITAYTAFSGFCSATQENFSAGTLDYKGPLDYISTKEDATVEGILTTKKLTVTDGASASTIGYVLTQLDSSGRAGWVFNSASASTNTFVTGGTLNGTNLDLTWNTGGSVPSIDLSYLSGGAFTSTTANNRIVTTNLQANSVSSDNSSILGGDSNTINTNSARSIIVGGRGNTVEGEYSFIGNGLGNSISGRGFWNTVINGDNNDLSLDPSSNYNTVVGNSHSITGTSLVANSILGGQSSGIYTIGGLDPINSTIVGGNGNSIYGPDNASIIGGGNNLINGENNNTSIVGGENNSILLTSTSSFIGGGENHTLSNTTNSVIIGGNGITGTSSNTVYVPNLNISTIGAGTSINNLGIDVNGNVVSGDTFTGNTSGDCITDLWLTNLYGCSPLHIEPSGVNDVYIVENGGNVGIGTTGTTEKLHVSGGDILVEYGTGKLISDLTGVDGPVFRLSGGTGTLSYYSALSPGFGATQIGVRGGTEASKPGYGKQGDGFIYSSADQNGLNIISEDGGASLDDYIRFYAGQTNGAAPANTPDIHIQGSGTTRGNVGINTKTPTEKLHVEGSIKMVDGNESNGYVLTSDANGVGSWVASAGGTFTGNTSGDCITDLWLTNLHSCSPLFINPLDEGNVYFGSNSGVTIDLLNGGEMLVKGDSITHSDTNSTSPLPGVAKGQYTEFNWSGITGGIVSNNSTSGETSYYVGDFSNFPTTHKHGSIKYYGSGYTRSGGATTTASSFYQNKVLIAGGADIDGMVIKPKGGDASGTLWFEVNGSSVAQLYSDSGYFGLGLNPDGTELPTAHLQVGGTGTTGTFKFLDGNEQSGYVLTSDANGVGSWVASSGGGIVTGLTTTGTSGPSTLVSGSLNVPEYAGGGGGVTIDPYQDEGIVTGITWDVSGTSTNYEAILSGNTTLTMSNVRNGDYGTLIVTQDGTGSRTLTFGAGTHKVVNGGGGSPTLTTTAGATDILSFTYNGTNFYWTVGNDYT